MSEVDNKNWVIGIGSSAGGLESLTELISELEEDFPAAIIIAQHLSPTSKSMMVELIARHSALPVVAIKDGMEILPGNIFIIPPNMDGEIQGKVIRLQVADEKTRPKPSVDRLFESLASSHRDKAIGIILSGTGSDGSRGMRSIKLNNGITVVQTPGNAKYDGMPNSSIDTGLVDLILPPKEMGLKLKEIIQRNPKDVLSFDLDDEGSIVKVLQLLKLKTSQNFLNYKRSTIRRRIQRRMLSSGSRTLDDYHNLLNNSEDEARALSQELLISVTSFFRDPEAFRALSESVKSYLSEHSPKEFRIWVPGCATGEEAYSLAILLLESFEEKVSELKIFASDLDEDALTKAREGRYSKDDLANVPEDIIDKYFTHHSQGFEVKKILRDIIVFARQDLVQNPPFIKVDLISCRNVFIYFDMALQKRIFGLFSYALKPNGILFLGKSEAAPLELFEIIDKLNRVFVKRELPPGQRMPPLEDNYFQSTGIPVHRRQPENVPEMDFLKGALSEIGTGVVAIDEESNVKYLSPEASKYLRLPSGPGIFKLSALLPEFLAVEFSILLRKILGSDIDRVQGRWHVDTKKEIELRLRIRLVPTPAPNILVLFEERGLHQSPVSGPETYAGEVTRRDFELLERELLQTRQSLQNSVEELEITNEELQSVNEELSSTNEELQASNEELVTTNEELQSSNEELNTVNAEVALKSQELQASNLYLETIQNTIKSPLLILDSDLRLIRFNRQARDLFGFENEDLGEHLLEVSSRVDIPQLVDLVTNVFHKRSGMEINIKEGSRFFEVQASPMFNDESKQRNVVLLLNEVTDMILTRDQLAFSEQRLSLLIEASPLMIAIKDFQGRYTKVNEAFKNFFGLDGSDVLGLYDREIFSKEATELFRSRDLESVLTKNNTLRQEKIEHKGESFTLRSHRFPLSLDGSPENLAIGWIAADITKENQIYEEMTISEDRYRALVEDQAVFVCRHDEFGRLTFVNHAFCEYFGGSKDLSHERSFLSIVDRRDQDMVKDKITEIRDSEEFVTEYTHRVIRLAKSPQKWVKWIHRPIYAQGTREITEYQAVGFDVTDSQLQTFRLLEKEKIFSYVVEHSAEYVVTYGISQGDFIVESMTGRHAHIDPLRSRFVGLNLRALSSESDYPMILKAFNATLLTKKSASYPESFMDANGKMIHLLTTIVPVTDNEGQVEKIVGISRDVSELRKLELKAREEKSLAESASKAKSEFLSMMSHEIRTPLNVISGMAQILDRDDKSQRQEKCVRSILSATRNLTNIINDILDITKIEEGKLTFEILPIRLEQVLREVEETFRQQFQAKGLELKIDPPQKEQIVLGDMVRIKQILINFIGNAFKFTEEGIVTISIREIDRGQDKPWYRFEVRDTGIGISDANLSKLFQRFSQAEAGTTRKFGGTGLGLSICKKIVELLGGEIGVQSIHGEGSVFWFELPLELAQAGAETKIKTKGPKELNLKGRHILYVDDIPDSRTVLKEMLTPTGCTVSLCESGYEALAKFQKGEHFDLVFMDIHMPGMDGIEATRLIRNLGGWRLKLPIIGLTANALKSDLDRALEAGMASYILKPIEYSELVEKLREVLGESVTK